MDGVFNDIKQEKQQIKRRRKTSLYQNRFILVLQMDDKFFKFTDCICGFIMDPNTLERKLDFIKSRINFSKKTLNIFDKKLIYQPNPSGNGTHETRTNYLRKIKQKVKRQT